MSKVEALLREQLKKDENPAQEPDIPEEEFSEIMDMLVDDDGVIIED